MGAFASRVTVMTGEATRIAAAEAAEQGDRDCCRIAASAGRRLDVVDGEVVRTDAAAGPSIALGDDRACAWPRLKDSRGRASGRTVGRGLVPHRTT